MMYTYVNKITSFRLSLCVLVSNTLEESFISIDEIKVKRNDEFYSYELVDDSQTNYPLHLYQVYFLENWD